MANMLYKINPVVVVGVPTLLSKAPISWDWADAYYGLAFPLGSSMARIRIADQHVADARNAIVEFALKHNAEWVLFISDDVIAPPRTFEMLWKHRRHLVTGVYWSKYHPTAPYLWRNTNGNFLSGPFTEWTYGEFFKVDWAGCDCLLVNTEVFKRIKAPWFSHDWAYQENSVWPANLATEDVYFYTKTREAGFELWCDSAVQCDHVDRETGARYGLTDKMPQFVDREKKWRLHEPGKKIADIGAGKDTPFFGEHTIVTRIDGDPEVLPDILCDVRSIPVESEFFDVVHSRHVLEHFPIPDLDVLIKEWLRVLKVGGELIIVVPDLAYAAKEILKADADPDYDATYALWQLYGQQKKVTLEEVHKLGFTRHGLLRLLKRYEEFVDVEGVERIDSDCNLCIRATKKTSSHPKPILKAWNDTEKDFMPIALMEKGNNGHDEKEIGTFAEDFAGD